MYKFVMERQELFKQVRNNLHKARKRMLKYVDQKQRLFIEGNKVLLKLTP